MSSRNLHPLACRLSRGSKCDWGMAIARGVSVSGLIKQALRQYLSGVHPRRVRRVFFPALGAGSNPSVTRLQSPQHKGLPEAFAASPTAASNNGEPNGSRGWIDTDVGLVGTFFNRRLKPKPPPDSPPSGNKFVDTY